MSSCVFQDSEWIETNMSKKNKTEDRLLQNSKNPKTLSIKQTRAHEALEYTMEKYKQSFFLTNVLKNFLTKGYLG